MKKFIKSKTLWINVIAIGAIIAQCEFGFIVTPESQIIVLSAVNFILRVITNEELK